MNRVRIFWFRLTAYLSGSGCRAGWCGVAGALVRVCFWRHYNSGECEETMSIHMVVDETYSQGTQGGGRSASNRRSAGRTYQFCDIRKFSTDFFLGFRREGRQATCTMQSANHEPQDEIICCRNSHFSLALLAIRALSVCAVRLDRELVPAVA